MIDINDESLVKLLRRGDRHTESKLKEMLHRVRIDKRVTQSGMVSYYAIITEDQEIHLQALRNPGSLWPPRLPSYNVDFSSKQMSLIRVESSNSADLLVNCGSKKTFRIIEEIYSERNV
ncbi:hypothetical protein COV17_04165 [Candidatus Woesearchaeota archaeon CG10_big_fil_rev_8_21_14_0_10_36_11]|nr:MAG: hypothetical protein COV17_04165 [Candidatus Woesearchaeota archaeon CG10_big_fil_rev_8_21_14_0_10_36_11]